jgi:sugar/nucleoside kinase (ribokinase family)
MGNRVPSGRRKVACAGILVADIFVPPLPLLPAAGALVATEDFLLETGGCAANTGTLLAALGGDVTVCGVVGDDVFADFITSKLASRGLRTDAIRKDRGGTSKTVILTVAGEDRRFLHTFGANTRFAAADLRNPAFDDAAILYVGGYLILPGLDPGETAKVFEKAQSGGTKVVLDVVVPAGDASGLAAVQAVLPHVDVFMPNDEEAATLTGLEDPIAQAERFLSMGCRSVVITQGSRGTLAAEDDKMWATGVYPIRLVDGSGAGDAFAAGFILGLLEGWDTPQRLRFAGAVGALACTKLGCTAGVTGRAAVEQLMAEHPIEVRCLKGEN